jgi:hypothetical protein
MWSSGDTPEIGNSQDLLIKGLGKGIETKDRAQRTSKIAPENYSRGVTGPSSMKWGWDEGTRPSSDARKRIVFGVRVLTKHNGSSRAADAASLPHLIHGCGSPTSTHGVLRTLIDSREASRNEGARNRSEDLQSSGVQVVP